MNGRKGSFNARKPGFPSPKTQPLKRDYEEAPRSPKGRGHDKPKVTDLPLGDRRSARMVRDTDNDGM